MVTKTLLTRLRESERELESQLAKLRSQIREVKRGENKRIKDANRFIDRTLRKIEHANKAQEKLQEKELTRLERFLGETFETVGEAREALGRQTRKATKREKLSEALRLRQRPSKRAQHEAERLEREVRGQKLDPNRLKYSIRQLSEIEHQQVIDFLSDKRTFQSVGLDYLRPDERITVSVPYDYMGADGRQHVGYGVGRKIFRTWDELQAYIRVQYFSEAPDDADWLGKIEIIKFPTEYEYRIERGRQTDTKNTRRKAVRKMYSDRRKARDKKRRAAENARAAKLKAENKELKRQLKGRK